jgi:hypothetical protein
MVPTYHSTHSHNHHSHNINKTTSFLALLFLFLDTFTSCSMLFRLQSTDTTTVLSCIMQHSLINFIIGVLLYKLLFTTQTHAIAEECFTPHPPSNRKRNFIYIQHISSFGADIKARICTFHTTLNRRIHNTGLYGFSYKDTVFNGRKMNILHIFTLNHKNMRITVFFNR